MDKEKNPASYSPDELPFQEPPEEQPAEPSIGPPFEPPSQSPANPAQVKKCPVDTVVKVVDEITEHVLEVSTILSNTAAAYHAAAQTALNLNSIALAHKSDVKDALERSRRLGKILDCAIKLSKKKICCFEKLP